MTNLLILVAIVLIVIILLILLKSKNPISGPLEQIINHDLTDEEVDSINNHLLEGGKFRIDVGNGKTARLFTFIDILLLNLNSSNNDLILDHQKNQDTVDFLTNLPIEMDGIDNTLLRRIQNKENLTSLSEDTLSQIKAGQHFKIEQVGKRDICPPPTGGGDRLGTSASAEERTLYLWRPKAAQYVINLSQKLSTNVYITDPAGHRLLPEIIDGVVYSFEKALIANKRPGYHIVTFIINDLEKNKVGTFEQLILVEA